MYLEDLQRFYYYRVTKKMWRKAFEDFKQIVRTRGGMWDSGNVRFMGLSDGFAATLENPNGSGKYAVTYNTATGVWRDILPEQWNNMEVV